MIREVGGAEGEGRGKERVGGKLGRGEQEEEGRIVGGEERGEEVGEKGKEWKEEGKDGEEGGGKGGRDLEVKTAPHYTNTHTHTHTRTHTRAHTLYPLQAQGVGSACRRQERPVFKTIFTDPEKGSQGLLRMSLQGAGMTFAHIRCRLWNCPVQARN